MVTVSIVPRNPCLSFPPPISITMALQRLMNWNPYATSSLLPSLSDFPDVDRAFGNIYPRCDVYTKDDHTIIDLEVPGMTKDNVSVRYDNDRLVIEGKMDSGEIEKEGRTWKMRERSASSFRREFTVPKDMDPNKIKTSLRNGVLEIDLPELQKTLSTENKGHSLAIEE